MKIISKGKKVLITDRVHTTLVKGLSTLGLVVDYRPRMSLEEVRHCLSSYNGLIINSKIICDTSFIDLGRHLDFIGRLGSGLDIIDLDYAADVGIKIISSPEGNANAVGEHVLGMLLALLHRISMGHLDVRNRNWKREENRGSELKGSTIGIIGFGHTGPAFAEKLSGLGVEILIYDKYRTIDREVYPMVRQVALQELIAHSDILSIHLPLTDETRFIIDTAFISKMKRGAIFINSSRGHIVDSNALKKGLKSGHLSGVCLDVLENERPESWSKEEEELYGYFLKSDRVVITPHIAGWTVQSLELIASVLLDKIQKFYNL